MADIKVFKEGESILASDTNNNNNVLLSKINDHYTQVDNYVKGELGTIKSEVGSAKADLENKINEVKGIVNSVFVAIAPDYKSGKTLTSGDKMTTHGWVNWNGGTIGDSSTAQMYVNGVGVGYHTYYKYGDKYKTMFYVNKDDVITFTNGTSAVFYPCKGFEEV